jgi:hypothetical protein
LLAVKSWNIDETRLQLSIVKEESIAEVEMKTFTALSLFAFVCCLYVACGNPSRKAHGRSQKHLSNPEQAAIEESLKFFCCPQL